MALKTLKIIGLLLSYPNEELLQNCNEIRKVLKDEGWLPEDAMVKLEHLLKWLEETDLLDVQEEYVSLFDRTPSLSLHLFEHVHGDSRDRGQAMVDLSMLYEEKGLRISTEETPDYLPMFLEYISMVPAEQASENMEGAINVVAAIGERLKNRESVYANAFIALEAVAGCKPDPEIVKKALVAASGSEPTLDEIDESWEEQYAMEQQSSPQGESGSECPNIREMLSRMEQPVSPVEERQ